MRVSATLSRIPLTCIILAGILITLGCSTGTPPASATIELVITQLKPDRFDSAGTGGGASPLTIVPETPLEISSYTITGSGPGTETFELVSDNTKCVIESIALGSWTIIVEGENCNGQVVAQGGCVTEVAAENTAVTVSLEPIPGTGEISVNVVVSGVAYIEGILHAEIEDIGGVTEALTITKVSTGLYTASGTVAAGVYMFTAALCDADETVIAGGVSVVYVLADSTTTGEIAVSYPPEPTGNLDLAVKTPATPPDIHIAVDRNGPYFVGSSVVLSLEEDRVGTPLPDNYRVSWYANGQSIGTYGANFTWLPESHGTYRFDAIVTEGSTPIGSAEFYLDASVPESFGPVTYLGSLFDNSDGIDGLSGVRDCTSSSTGVLYAAGYSESSIAVFFTEDTSSLPIFHRRIRTSVDVPLTNVMSLDITTDGSLLGAAGGEDTIALLALGPDGIPTGAATVLYPATDSGHAVTSVVAAAFSTDDTFLFALCDEPDLLLVYAIDPSTHDGTFSEAIDIGSEAHPAPTHEPVALAVSPAAEFIAISGKTSDSVAIYSYDPTDGSVLLSAYYADGEEGVDTLNGGGGLSFSADGTCLYTASYYDDAITHFRHEAETGWVYISSYIDGENSIAGMHYPKDVSVSNDGEWLYVASSGDDSLAVFSRNPTTGELVFIDAATNGMGSIEGLDGARSVGLTPDGCSVFVAASNDSAIGVFSVLGN